MRKRHCHYADDVTINHIKPELGGAEEKEERNGRRGMLFLQPHRMFVLTSWRLLLTVYAKTQ